MLLTALIVEADHVGMAPQPGKLWVYWIGESQISLVNWWEVPSVEIFLLRIQWNVTDVISAQRRKTDTAVLEELGGSIVARVS